MVQVVAAARATVPTDHELLDAAGIEARFPAVRRLPDDAVGVYQKDGAIIHADAVLQTLRELAVVRPPTQQCATLQCILPPHAHTLLGYSTLFQPVSVVVHVFAPLHARVGL